jgi:hypothetical protein
MIKRLAVITTVVVFVCYCLYVLGRDYDIRLELEARTHRIDTASIYVNTTWRDTVVFLDGMRLEGHYYYTDVYSGTRLLGTVWHPAREVAGRWTNAKTTY